MKMPNKAVRHMEKTENLLPGNVQPLWTVADCAAYLQRSRRWIGSAMTIDPRKPGSIPFFRLPGRNGSDGHPRFVPALVQAWAAAGCPPAATVATWRI